QSAAVETRSLADRLTGLPADERQAVLLDLVRTHVAAVLGFTDAEAIEPQRAFREVGFDSLTAVEFRNQLGAATGLRLPATVVFDYPNPAEVAEYLSNSLPGGGAKASGADGGSAGSVLDELEALEGRLDGLAADAAEKARIAAKLESLLARWTDTRSEGRADTAEQEAADVTDVIENATDDEMFEFIGREFGIS
ncbi:phosphopantetheine-binding protein, partial [Streptomyces orinoci]